MSSYEKKHTITNQPRGQQGSLVIQLQKLHKNYIITRSSFQSMDSHIWIPIYITALLSKSTDQGFTMIMDAWIQSSWLFNGTTYTCSKLFSLAVKLVAWLYDWAFIAHCYSPSPCLQWNASGVYTPIKACPLSQSQHLLCGDQYVRGWQLSSDELHLLSLGGGTFMLCCHKSWSMPRQL